MKKKRLFLFFLTILAFSIILLNKTFVHASYDEQFHYFTPSSSSVYKPYLDARTLYPDIPNDNLFGTPYEGESDDVLYDYHTFPLNQYAYGAGTSSTTQLARYRIVTWNYPIYLDTLAAIVTPGGDITGLYYPEMLMNGEYLSYNWQTSTSTQIEETYSQLFQNGVNESSNLGISVAIPEYGASFGFSIDSSASTFLEQKYQISALKTINVSYPSSVYASNTSNQAYYQNGTNIYVLYGVRAVLQLHVTAIFQINWTDNLTYSGLFNYNTYHHYSYSTLSISSMYVAYTFAQLPYQRTANPFVYIVDPNTHLLTLIPDQKVSGRIYIN